MPIWGYIPRKVTQGVRNGLFRERRKRFSTGVGYRGRRGSAGVSWVCSPGAWGGSSGIPDRNAVGFPCGPADSDSSWRDPGTIGDARVQARACLNQTPSDPSQEELGRLVGGRTAEVQR